MCDFVRDLPFPNWHDTCEDGFLSFIGQEEEEEEEHISLFLHLFLSVFCATPVFILSRLKK